MRIRKILLLLLLLVLLIGGFAAYKIIGPATRKPADGFLYIPTGSSMADVKRLLVEQKVVSSTYWFSLTARAVGYDRVKPGKYAVPSGTSMLTLVRKLNNGRQSPVEFVITKLRTKESLAGKVGRQFECDSLAFINFLNSPDSLSRFNLDTNTVMAAVMPYNYELKWTTTPGHIMEQFEAAYKRFWTDERKAKATDQGLSPMQVMILASIVEEESNDAEDRLKIASTYINRYKKGMLLQADPTVKFALKDFALRRILFGHLKAVSPYNTYLNKGLPPGPICTPSQQAIESVLNAPKTEYIYFVASAKFDGSHIFTTNYEDHMKYAREFQAELTRRQNARKNAP
ncbi:endolytic transglycosylase MltG [Terrimonas ferruginea]|uniref:endolytic transglycosylase MltG n=1 Tax=Terrimonas ferruginea TaxID=249 RepID=UPI000424BC22|nr:endolytic transglycosylase MltG [Terrimonas ferruginea]